MALAEEQPQDEGFVFTLFGREIRTGWSDSAVSYLLVGLFALCVVLLAAVIVLVVCLVKARKALHLEWARQEEEQWKALAGSKETTDLLVGNIVDAYEAKSEKSVDETDEISAEEPDRLEAMKKEFSGITGRMLE